MSFVFHFSSDSMDESTRLFSFSVNSSHLIFNILGAEGRRGPKGEPGTPGEKGDPGSFDFLMLMVSDLRHDLEQLKSNMNGNGGSSTGAKLIKSTPSVS